MENYLVAIHDLEESNRVARVKDIAAYLGVKMPSVTGAIRMLRDKGLVDHEKNSFTTLTDDGKRIAEATKKKREVLTHFFEDVLLLDSKRAGDIACLVEHNIDDEIMHRLEKTLTFLVQAMAREQLTPDRWKQHVEEERN
jgi:DtxR family Mn-dependent transcriptional regulator